MKRDLGRSRPSQPEELRGRPSVTFSVWMDPLARLLLILGLIANVALSAYIGLKYRSLPEFLPLHFDASGQVDRIGTRGEIFKLPVIGLIVVVANLVMGFLLHGRERLATYLLFAATILVQVLFWVATLNIVY